MFSNVCYKSFLCTSELFCYHLKKSKRPALKKTLSSLFFHKHHSLFQIHSPNKSTNSISMTYCKKGTHTKTTLMYKCHVTLKIPRRWNYCEAVFCILISCPTDLYGVKLTHFMFTLSKNPILKMFICQTPSVHAQPAILCHFHTSLGTGNFWETG